MSKRQAIEHLATPRIKYLLFLLVADRRAKLEDHFVVLQLDTRGGILLDQFEQVAFPMMAQMAIEKINWSGV